MKKNSIETKHGTVCLPAFLPVVTYSEDHPVDFLVRPLETAAGEMITPEEVLKVQTEKADIGATLDFICSPDLSEEEKDRRIGLTVKNALYAKERCPEGLTLYASLQCKDVPSAGSCAEIYAAAGFSGIAIGGMVPHAADPDYIASVVSAVRNAAPDCLIHVFGIGKNETIQKLLAAEADSFDSSSYARTVVDNRLPLYEALRNLYEINTKISGSDMPVEDAMTNFRLISFAV